MNRQLKRKELIVIFILTAVLLGLVYYQFIYKTYKQAVADYDVSDIETQIQMETAKSASIAKMEKEIEENQGSETGSTVESYDNMKNEINALNDILSDAVTFDLSFEQPVASGNVARRQINVSFTANDYTSAKAIIQALHDCKYRCLITDLSINPTSLENSSSSGTDLSSGPVAVDLSVTFYETLYDATTTDGLQVEEDSTSDTSSLTSDLANSKEQAESTGEDQG
jgi:hypothetical protein